MVASQVPKLVIFEQCSHGESPDSTTGLQEVLHVYMYPNGPEAQVNPIQWDCSQVFFPDYLIFISFYNHHYTLY